MHTSGTMKSCRQTCRSFYDADWLSQCSRDLNVSNMSLFLLRNYVVVVVVVDPTPPTCCQQSPAPEIMWQPAVSPPRWQGKERVPVAGWPKKRELGPLSSGQGKSMQFVDPDRIEQSDHVQAASFAPLRNYCRLHQCHDNDAAQFRVMSVVT